MSSFSLPSTSLLPHLPSSLCHISTSCPLSPIFLLLPSLTLSSCLISVLSSSLYSPSLSFRICTFTHSPFLNFDSYFLFSPLISCPNTAFLFFSLLYLFALLSPLFLLSLLPCLSSHHLPLIFNPLPYLQLIQFSFFTL